jgi:hypothetical protein
VGVFAGIRSGGQRKGGSAVTDRLLRSLIFAVATVGLVGVLFDAGKFVTGSSHGLVRWGWAATLGLVVGLVCYRTSSIPASQVS